MKIAEIFLQFRNQQGVQLSKPAWHVMIVEDDGSTKMLSATKAVERGLPLAKFLSDAVAELLVRAEKAEAAVGKLQAQIEAAGGVVSPEVKRWWEFWK